MTSIDIDTIKKDYLVNGVTVVRGIISSNWLKTMQTAIDYILANPGKASIEYTPSGKKGRYYGDFFIWMRNKSFKDFAFQSILPELAGIILDSKKINFFYDQLLVKEPNTDESTPYTFPPIFFRSFILSCDSLEKIIMGISSPTAFTI